MRRDIAKRAAEVLGPEDAERTRKIAEALLGMDAAVIEAFGRKPDAAEGAVSSGPRSQGHGPMRRKECVVEVDLSIADANGALKAFGGAESDRANELLITKTHSAVSASDERTLAAMREMKPRDFLEGMALSLAVSAYAAAMDSFAHAKDAQPLARGEHLTQATRSALTVAALVDAVRRHHPANAANAGLPRRSSREANNAYQRDLMRRRRALAKARQMEGRPQ